MKNSDRHYQVPHEANPAKKRQDRRLMNQSELFSPCLGLPQLTFVEDTWSSEMRYAPVKKGTLMGQRQCPYCGFSLSATLIKGRIGLHPQSNGRESCQASGLTLVEAISLSSAANPAGDVPMFKGDWGLGYCPTCGQKVTVYEYDITVPPHKRYPNRPELCSGAGTKATRAHLMWELPSARGGGGNPEFPAGFHS
jgi:hypothetical protein